MKALSLSVYLHPNPILWSWALGSAERIISLIQAAELCVLCRVAGLSLRDRVWIFDILREFLLDALLLHVKKSQLMLFGHLFRICPPLANFGHIWLGASPGADPEHKDYESYLLWECYTPQNPLAKMENVPGDRDVWTTCLLLNLPPWPHSGKKMDGLTDNVRWLCKWGKVWRGMNLHLVNHQC